MDFGNVDTRKWFLGTGLFVAVLFAVIDPEGSAPGTFAIRLVQWLFNVFVPLGILIAVHGRLNHWTNLAQSRPWLALTISGLMGAVLFSPIALALDVLFGANVMDEPSGTAWLSTWMEELAGVTGPVVLVWLGMNAPAILGLDFDGREAQARDGIDAPASAGATAVVSASERSLSATGEADAEDRSAGHSRNDFLDLLPDRIGRDIAWMKSELHYLRVVTPLGKALVLFNLRDAAELMPEEEGVMPHRSYWIAYRHVERLVSSDGRTELIMTDGTRIPVARRRRAEVRRRVGL